MISLKNKELRFALDAVRRAVAVTREVETQITHGPLAKEDHSPVTIADFTAQALVASFLDRHFPKDSLVAEESSEALRKPEQKVLLDQMTVLASRHWPKVTGKQLLTWIDRGRGAASGRFWILDPVDGTKGFLRGEHYAVAFALIESGRVKVSVLGCPHLGRDGTFQKSGPGILLAAVAGAGAWVSALDEERFAPLKVSAHQKPAEIQMLRSVELAHVNTGAFEPLFGRHGFVKPPLLMDSQAKYAVVAAGQGDLFFYLLPVKCPDYRMKIWDVAPGALVVEEAGGKITDLNGKALDFTCGDTLANNPGIVVSNGPIHALALKLLQELQLERQRLAS